MSSPPFRDALRDRYRIERELGRGGMATVYLAQDLKHSRPVGLKGSRARRTCTGSSTSPSSGWCSTCRPRRSPVREGERGLALIKDLHSGLESHYLLRQMALAYLLVGERDRAVDTLEQLLGIKQHYSAGWLRVDPTFAGLRGEERFRRITGKPTLSP
jgi:hypothetical protein